MAFANKQSRLSINHFICMAFFHLFAGASCSTKILISMMGCKTLDQIRSYSTLGW